MTVPLRLRFVLAAALGALAAFALDGADARWGISPAGRLLAAFAAAWVIGFLLWRQPLRVLERVARRLRRILARDLRPQRPIDTADPVLKDLVQSAQELTQFIRESWDAADRRLGEIESIVDDLADAVIATDASSRITRANVAAGQFFGHLPHSSMVGLTIVEATLNHTLDAMVRSCIETATVTEGVLDLFGPRERSVSAVIIPRTAPGERVTGAVAVLHDITEIRRVDRLHRDFVANASHELRTPLASIKVMTESLLNGAVDEPELARRFVQSIAESAERLTALVDDLLFLAVRESGHTEEGTVVDVDAVARSVAEKLAPAAEKRQVTLECDAASAARVAGDPMDVWRAIANLVDNAIRYTDPGGRARITTRRAGASVEIEVEDTGIGIAAEHQEMVFERFFRVDVVRSRESGGTGLGLSIVRQIVRSLGGDVSLRSTLGEGSTFTITLPALQEEGAGEG